MSDAHYLRSQAELCMDVARRLSDRNAAGHLKAKAADYLSRAAELEDKSENNKTSSQE
jgi:hypothetical protein